MKNIVLLYLISANIPLFSQSAAEDFAKVNEMYGQLNSFSCKLEYDYFTTHNSKTVDDKLEGYFFKMGDSYKLDLGSTIIVYDGIMMLNINSDLKQICIISDKRTITGVPIYTNKEFKKAAKAMKMVSDVNNEILYRSGATDQITQGLEYTDIQINKDLWIVDKITNYYKETTVLKGNQNITENPRIEILYTDYNEKAGLHPSFFAMSNWIKKTVNGYIPATEYKDYEIIEL